MEVYTVAEIADILKLSLKSIYNHINKGNIKAVRIGTALRVTQDELDRILKEGV